MDSHNGKLSARIGIRRDESRPLTSMGNAELKLEATQAKRAPLSGRDAGEFDVRRFLLDQKAEQPLHKSSLFRVSATTSSSTGRLGSPGSPPTFRETKSRKKLLPRMDVTQSTSSLPRPSTTHSEALHTRRGMQREGNNLEEDDCISHFYTLERMGESCYHAVQNRNKTWLFLPGAEERSKGGANSGNNALTSIERPSRRADLLDLQRCYDAALQFASKKHDRDVECSDRLAMVDRDFVAIQARVSDKYAARVSGGNEEDVAADHKVLARLFFEQKWADVVLGELEAMLTVSFLEQGVALRKARIQYAQAFFHLEKLYATQWSRYHDTLENLERLRADSRRTDEVHEQRVREMKEKYEGEIKRMSAVFDVTKHDMERKVAESKDQMTKMADTMKTLNAIFRQMREDTDKVKAVELRENYIKLEQKHEALCEEVMSLRPLVEQNAQLVAQIEELVHERDKFKDDMAQLDVLLSAKDETIATLMERQSDLLAAQELREAKEEEMRRRAAEEKEEEEEDDAPIESANAVVVSDAEAPGSPSSPPSRKRLHRSGSSVVCVRCKQELRAMSAGGGVTENSSARRLSVTGADTTEEYADRDLSTAGVNHIQAKRKRIQCLYFRILLPNLRGRRPQREPAWTFSCMRAILFSKQIDDAMTRRNGGAFPSRIRMPEFVYAWFAPWRSIKDEKLEAEFGVEASGKPGEGDVGADDHDDQNNDPSVQMFLSSEQRQMQADEERWCLYYGVKALVQQGYLEAKLFLSLMDEKFGEDELVFMLYCYQLLDVLVGGKLNWGPLRDKVAYHSFSREYENLFGPVSSPTTHPSAVVPKTIWISPYHASLATSIVLARATESERETLDQKMMSYVVTNVPDDERPQVFLTPEQMGIKGDMFGRKKPQRRHTVEDDSEESDPPQFIDAHLWVELMMLEYKEEQAHRRAAIRLMFQTATASITNGEVGNMAIGPTNGATMDMEQFRVMVRTLNDETPAFVIATLFRNAYTKGNGIVTFDAFMEAAEANQFFSTCMRLESPASCIARLASSFNKVISSSTSPMLTAIATSSRAAFIVEKLFTLLRHELTAMVAALPLWTRSVTDGLVYDVASTLMGSDDGSGGGSVAYTDGMRLLVSFHRLIEYLQLVKLVKREVTGDAVSSKHIFSIEKALNALVDSVRLRDKSSVELLMETVKQKLCVKRVQLAFRQHLQREFGAPLAMRALLHRDYGRSLYAQSSMPTPSSSSMPSFRTRHAMRSLGWLLSIISAIFRLSLKSDRVPTLLLELSSVSSAFVSSTNQHFLDSPGSSSAGNNGVGPAPRSVLLELVYDFFISKFGTRWEAEKLIHDLFTTCRGAIRGEIPGSESNRGHPLAWIFGYVCCMDALPPWPQLSGASSQDSDQSLDDRILGQNEAVAFVQAILRCGMHQFALLDPRYLIRPVEESNDSSANLRSQLNERWMWPTDWIDVQTAENLLVAAFEQLGADRTQRMRARLRAEAANADSSDDVLDANTFLVLSLREWRRYIKFRMDEVRAICQLLESDEISQFERVLPLETIATVLQKAGVMFSGDELGIVFRRLLATEPPPTASGSDPATRFSRPSSSSSSRSSLVSTKERLSERVAAASFPLLAREPLNRLSEIEDAATERFKIAPNGRLSLDLLLRSWREYEESARELIDKLRHVGKSNDIQAEAFSRSGVGASPSPHRHVLYLSSSTSGNLSSQDVAQLEAVHTLFLERLAVATSVVVNANDTRDNANAAEKRRSSSVTVSKHDGSLRLLDDEQARENAVNEAWKCFRQLLVALARLRARAGLGAGALPDALDGEDIASSA